jgi:O-antigen/teichoic acid export membrane protein
MREYLTSGRVIFRNAAAQLVGFGASSVYMLLLVPLAVGAIGLEQFGLWTLMLAVTGYVSLIDAGLSTSFTKFVSEYASGGDDAAVNSVVFHGLIFYAVISLAALGIGFVFGDLLLSALDIPSGQRSVGFFALMVSLAAFGVSTLTGVFGSLLSGIQRSDVVNLHLAGTLAAKLVVIAGVISVGLGLPGILWADAAVSALALLPMVWLAKRYYPPLSFGTTRFDRSMLSRLFRFGGQMQVSRFADIVQSQFDKLLIARFLNLSSVSVYDFGARPLYRIRVLPLAPLTALLPAFSAFDAQANTSRMQAMYVRSVRYLAITAVPLFGVAFLLAEDFLVAWLGESQPGAALTLRILSGGLLLNVMTAVLAIAAQGKGLPRFQMQSMLIQGVINILLSFVCIRLFGFYGAPLGTALAMTAGALLFMRLCGDRVIPGALQITARALGKPLLATLGAAIVSVPVYAWLAGLTAGVSRGVAFTNLAVILPLFLAAYVWALVALRGATGEDVAFFRNAILSRKTGDESIPPGAEDGR